MDDSANHGDGIKGICTIGMMIYYDKEVVLGIATQANMVGLL